MRFKLYQTLGIREYWLIYPESETLSGFRLNQNSRCELADSYSPDGPDELDESPANPQIKVGIFDDLWIDFNLVSE